MTSKTKVVLSKWGRWLGAVAISAVVTVVVSPDVLNLIPSGYDFIVTGFLVPVLAELDQKFFGSNPSTPPAPPLAPPAA